jgi:mycobactin peptide synthetase MbtF
MDRMGDVAVTMSISDVDLTARLLDGPTPAQDLLAVAAARTINRWRRHRGRETAPPLLALETHGRADGIVADADTSDTVGLLTAIYPLRVPEAGAPPPIPGDGIDYGLLRYARPDTAARLQCYAEPQVLLNFLGRIHVAVGGNLRPDRALLAGVSPLPEPDLAMRHELTIVAAVIGDGDVAQLATQWRTLPDILSSDDVAVLQAMWQDSLREVVS